MPEPFKNVFNTALIRHTATQFKKHWDGFDKDSFIETAETGLEKLELKARSEHIAQAMTQYLPREFPKAAELMLKSLGRDDIPLSELDSEGLSGWIILPMNHYVGLHGLDNFDISMSLLKEMTSRFTSEFGIRFFLLKHQEKTLATMNNWTSDSNYHVRRLASEGCRPRLPWAMQLPAFIKNPEPLLQLLEKLKDDSEKYVRLSVANNLNDIAKDHPDIVAELAGRWMKNAGRNRQRLVRHACRSLIKAGHKKTLEVLGYEEAKIADTIIKILSPTVFLGSHLEFQFEYRSTSKFEQKLIIDYAIHHQKANGKRTAKVFKWKDITLKPEQRMSATKKHPFKKITTRSYYPGLHSVEIIINGTSIKTADFQLLVPELSKTI